MCPSSSLTRYAVLYQLYRDLKLSQSQVMVATSGARLLPEEAIRVLCDQLLPITNILTPNIPEALLLLRETGHDPGDIKDLDDMKTLAKSVASLGPKSVLIKGGHIPLTKNCQAAKTDDEKHILVNVLYSDGECSTFESEYQISRNTHGTGCSLACESSPHQRV